MRRASLPKISVIVLAYNHDPYIASCMDSILQQDYVGEVEILVGEDQSSDNTGSIVRRYALDNPRVVKVVTSDSNVGMHANHRRLLDVVSGDLVAYCEGDDFWHAKDKLALQVDHLARYPRQVGVHSDVDHMVRVRGRWYVMHDYWRQHLDRPAETTHDDLIVRNSVQTCSVMLRADVATSFGASPLAAGKYHVEDWPLFLHATTAGPLGLIERSLATYRQVAGSVTQNGPLAAERRLADQFRLIEDAANLAGASLGRRQAGINMTRDALVWNAVQARDGSMLTRALDLSRDHGADPHRHEAILRGVARRRVTMAACAAAGAARQAAQLLKYRRP